MYDNLRDMVEGARMEPRMEQPDTPRDDTPREESPSQPIDITIPTDVTHEPDGAIVMQNGDQVHDLAAIVLVKSNGDLHMLVSRDARQASRNGDLAPTTHVFLCALQNIMRYTSSPRVMQAIAFLAFECRDGK